jgi:hypothetical protein
MRFLADAGISPKTVTFLLELRAVGLWRDGLSEAAEAASGYLLEGYG